MDGPLIIHDATPHDAPVIARIDADSWNAGFGDLMPVRPFDFDRVECWRLDLDAPLPYRWWVAELGGIVVGFAGIGPSRTPSDPELGEIDTIAIDPAHWRQGLGRTLMAVAVENLEALLSVKGVDMVQFGPADYSMSLGIPGQRSDPRVKEAERHVIDTALSMGIATRSGKHRPRGLTKADPR